MRVKRVGAPAWRGEIGWNNGTVWDGTTVAEPAWDANGIATLDLSEIDWAENAEIDRIRVQLAEAVSGTDYFLFDWVAIGRPTPGASVALVQAETQARIAGDSAEATARQTLAAQMRGSYEGTDVAGVTTGLVYSERQARVAGDSANASQISSLQARMPSGNGLLATAASVTEEQTARVTADEALAEDITALSSELEGKASASALAELTTEVQEIDGTVTAMSESVQVLSAQLDGENAGDTDWNAGDTTVYAGSLTVYTVIADGDHALASQLNQLDADFGELSAGVTQQLEAVSDEVSSQASALQAVAAQVADKASAGSVALVTARVDTLEGGVAANASSISAINATLPGKADASTVAAMQSQVTQQGQNITANANQINQVSASVAGKADASVVQSLNATVVQQGGVITEINARYFLAVDVNGRVGGMMIGNNGQVVDVAFLADSFSIVSPNGGRRFEYANGLISVFDENNIARVEIGLFN